MISAYRIGVTLSLNNQLMGPLSKVIAELQKAESIVASLQKGLSGLNVGNMGGAIGGVKGLNEQLKEGTKNAAAMSATMPGMHGNGGFGFIGKQAPDYSKYKEGAGGMIESRPPPQGGRGDPYEKMFAGGVMAEVGKSILFAPYEEAKKLAQAKADFSTLNLSSADNDKVSTQAVTLSQQVLGSTITGNIKAIQDLHTAFGDLHHAIDMSKPFQTFAMAAEMKEGKPVEGLIYNAAKALEHRGGRLTTSPEKFSEELDMMSKVYFGSKGKVSPSDYFAASQTGKMAYKMYSPEFLYGPYASYVQEKTGTTAGTAGMTAFMSLEGGHMDKKAKAFLHDLGGGIYEESISKARLKAIRKAQNEAGIKKGDADFVNTDIATGGLTDKYAALFASNPDKFTNDVLVPAIQKKYGLDANIPLILAKNFNRNTGDFLAEWYVNKSKNEKDAKIFQASTGFSGAFEVYKKSPQGAELAADSAWRNFLALFGSVYLPQITKGLTGLAVILSKVSDWSQKNPSIFKTLVYGLVGLGVAGVVAGGVLLLGGMLIMLKGAFSGMAVIRFAGSAVLFFAKSLSTSILFLGRALIANPVGLIITGIAVAALLLYKNWSTVQPKLQAAWNAIKSGVDSVVSFIIGKWNAVKSFFSMGGLLGNTNTGMRLPSAPPLVHSLRELGQVSNSSPYIASKQQAPINVTVVSKLDGREIAKSTVKVMSKEANKPQAGSSMFDYSMAQPSAGLAYGR